MNILLTNDDGIEAEGIKALYSALIDEHAVFIVAPRYERSGCSNAITVRDSIRVEKMGERMFAVNGFTADCVNIGLHSDLVPGVDLVVSGINHGPNLGDDVFFSGTVAGARTAFVFGVPGIAISLDCLNFSDYFNEAAQFLRDFIREHHHDISRGAAFFNINYPDLPHGEIRGPLLTRLGRRKYQDTYNVTASSHNLIDLIMEGTIESDTTPGTDTREVRNGYISITPLLLDCTDHEYLRIRRG